MSDYQLETGRPHEKYTMANNTIKNPPCVRECHPAKDTVEGFVAWLRTASRRQVSLVLSDLRSQWVDQSFGVENTIQKLKDLIREVRRRLQVDDVWKRTADVCDAIEQQLQLRAREGVHFDVDEQQKYHVQKEYRVFTPAICDGIKKLWKTAPSVNPPTELTLPTCTRCGKNFAYGKLDGEPVCNACLGVNMLRRTAGAVNPPSRPTCTRCGKTFVYGKLDGEPVCNACLWSPGLTSQ